ncbi:MAG: hypothetical protein GW802_16285 [Armatimonadetes bacterium]|nr:hypothetical protein [Armatimonadota bacterium]
MLLLIATLAGNLAAEQDAAPKAAPEPKAHRSSAGGEETPPPSKPAT